MVIWRHSDLLGRTAGAAHHYRGQWSALTMAQYAPCGVTQLGAHATGNTGEGSC